MKDVIIRISVIFVAITLGFLAIYTLACLSAFFILKIIDIPLIAAIAYGISSVLAIITTAIVFKNIKKILISIGILTALTIITASTYIVIVNFQEFKTKISSILTPDFALGFVICVIIVIASTFLNNLFTKK